MENITKEQADIIGEVANICTGTAATALSMIINRSTNITTPLVEVLDKENTLESDNHILVKVPYTSGLDGTNLMVLDVQDALVIASLMMGGDGRNLSNLQLDDLTLSAIAEAMNQMCGSMPHLWRHCYPGRQILDFRLSIQRIARLSRFRMNYVMEQISSRSLFA